MSEWVENTRPMYGRCGHMAGEIINADEPSRKELEAECAKLRERAERAERLLHDLTPTGSEFARDPQRCYEWVRDHMSSLLQDAITMAGERNEARRELAKIKAMTSTEGG